jgi:hypothetical protein
MSKIKFIFYYSLFFLLFSYNAFATSNLALNNEHINNKFSQNQNLNLYHDYKNNSYSHQDIKLKSMSVATKYIDWDKYDIPNTKPVTDDAKPSIEYNETDHDWLSSVWGKPFSNTAYFGMWTRHYQQHENHTKSNKLLAVCYKGYYLGSFINSHGDRTYSLGVQRSLYNDTFSIFEVEAGYRAGMLYGYKRYLRLFGTSFFPLVQLVADISLGNFVTQVSWSWIVFTIGFGYKF